MKRTSIAGAMILTTFLSACSATEDATLNNIRDAFHEEAAETPSEMTTTASNGAEITRITREQAADLCRKDGISNLPPEEMLDATLFVDTAEEVDTGWKVSGEFNTGDMSETISLTCTTFNGIDGSLPHAIATVIDVRGFDPER